jgi:threonine dehydratase
VSVVSLDDLQAAAVRVAGKVVRTPLLPAPWADTGRPLLLKPESLQPTGAFKLRGATNKIATLVAAGPVTGVITHSSGNHAQAVAAAARAAGVPAVIVIPDAAPPVKIEATRALGAEVVLVPVAERESRAIELAAERQLVMVPPYDDAAVIAGQGTIGLEIAADAPDVGLVLVPISGGGLISGIAAALANLCPKATIIGVEPELAADAAESLRRRELVSWAPGLTYRTAADGLRVTRLGALPWEHVQKYVTDIVTVSEDEIRAAVRRLAVGSRLVAEPSGAVATAAYLFHAEALPAAPTTVAIVSGGNIDPVQLAAILAE